MARIKRLPIHSIAKRLSRSAQEKDVFLGWLLPTEIEYVCRRSAERDRSLEKKREIADSLRKKGRSYKIHISFRANRTFAEELNYLMK
jgi:hypothetical protein